MTSDARQIRPAVRRRALTREQILTAALKIIDDGGVEALTMRRLGRALDRNPMAIYRHAADKDALLDGVVERVVDELVVPRGPDSGRDSDWEGALRRTAHAFRRVALGHPNVVPLLVTRPLSGPLTQRPLGQRARQRPGHQQRDYVRVGQGDPTERVRGATQRRLPITVATTARLAGDHELGDDLLDHRVE